MRHLLLHLGTGQHDLVCVDDDDEVTHVHMRSEGRLVLTSQQGCSVARQSTQHYILCIDDVPLTRLIARLRTISSHSSTHFPYYRDLLDQAAKGGHPTPGQGSKATREGWEGSKREGFSPAATRQIRV